MTFKFLAVVVALLMLPISASIQALAEDEGRIHLTFSKPGYGSGSAYLFYQGQKYALGVSGAKTGRIWASTIDLIGTASNLRSVADILGTAEPVCIPAHGPVFDDSQLVETHCHAHPERWLLENPGFVSGGNYRWFRDNFYPSDKGAAPVSYEVLNQEADTISPGSEGVIFLPSMMGAMAPIMLPGRKKKAYPRPRLLLGDRWAAIAELGAIPKKKKNP